MHLDSVIADEKSRQSVIEDAIQFISTMIGFAGKLSIEANIQSAEEFDINYRSLMRSLLQFVDERFSKYVEYDVSKSYVLIDFILNLVWNLTDKTPLVPTFVNADCAKMTMKWLEDLSFLHIHENIRESLAISIMFIVYNLSRHKEGWKALQEVEAFEILTKRKSLITEINEPEFTEAFSISLIALSRSDEEQKQNEGLILQISDNLLIKANKAFKNENWAYDGCHLSEYLYSLQGAFSNTSIVLHILGDPPNINKERIAFFAQLLCSAYGLLFNQDADYLEKLVVKSLLNIILCISNYEQYRIDLVSHKSLYTLIETLAKQPNQDVAKRIWSYFQKYEDANLTSDKLEIEKTPKLYISYNWADRNFCKLFIDALRNCTDLPIWVDYEKMNGLQDPWECVASGIDSATIIIVLVSTTYGQSKSNRQELTYALAKTERSNEKKTVIIVDTVPNFKFNRDWMKNLLEKYDKIPYHDNFNELADQVVNHSALFKHKKHSLIRFLSDNGTQSKVCTIT